MVSLIFQLYLSFKYTYVMVKTFFNVVIFLKLKVFLKTLISYAIYFHIKEMLAFSSNS